MQLTSPMPRPWTRRIGAITVALLALGTGFAVWSAQPARAPKAAIQATDLRGGDHRLDVTLRIDGDKVEHFSMVNPEGRLLKLGHQDGKGGWIDLDASVRPLDGGRFDVAIALKRNGRDVSQPRVIVAEGEPATVKVGEDKADGTFGGVELVMVVSDASRTPPPAPPAPPAAPDAVLPPVPAAPVARPARAPAPPRVAPPSPPSSPEPPSPPEPPAAAKASAASAAQASERALQATRRHAARAEQARAEAIEAQATTERHAAQSNADFEAGRAAVREAARAAAAAKDAEQAARAAEAVVFNRDAEAAEHARARYATMSPQEINAELEAIKQRVERRRAELRAADAARAARDAERGAAPAPAAE